MKFKFFISISLFCTFLSCTDMLEIDPEDKLSRKKFWNTKEDVLSAIIGTYSELRNEVESFVYWGEMRGDLLSSNTGKGNTLDKEAVDVFLVDANNTMTKNIKIYGVINQCNLVIKNIPEVMVNDASLTDPLSREYLGEARLLRAFCYLMLTRTFKEVPLVIDPSENDGQDFNQPKVSQETLYAFIEDDIRFAVENLPDTYSTLVQTKGRCTRYAALAMQAEVALTLGKYDLALQACNQIINSRIFTMVNANNYASIFYPGNSLESIWEFQYNKSLSQTNSLRAWCVSRQYFSGEFVRNLFTTDVELEYDTRLKTSINSAGLVYKYSATTDDAHWILYRLPDVMLLKAEALAHTSTGDIETNLAEVASIIEKIKIRSLLLSSEDEVEIPTVEPPVTVEDADEMILDERARELCFEGKRWFDLLRFASRDNFANKQLLTTRILASFNGLDQQTIGPRIMNPEAWYFPLNADDVSANPSLIQNPYYK